MTPKSDDNSPSANELKALTQRFDTVGQAYGCERMGSGNINLTWKITASTGVYVLQQINQGVFLQPEHLMDNAAIIDRALQGSRFPLRWPRYLKSEDQLWLHQAGEFWRLYPFISAQKARRGDRATTYNAAWVIGSFTRSLTSIKSAELKPPITDFHNLKVCLKALDTAISEDRFGRLKQAMHLLKKIDRYRSLSDLANAGDNRCITHNDAKLDNILFDQNQVATGLVDLDTVMPGQPLYDFGDLVRSCTDEQAEDEPPEPLQQSLLEAASRGYIQGLGEGLLDHEQLTSLAYGPVYMTFMLSIRFLTDFLEGDVYFRQDYPEHNLTRCQGQLTRTDYYADAQPFLTKLLASLSGL